MRVTDAGSWLRVRVLVRLGADVSPTRLKTREVHASVDLTCSRTGGAWRCMGKNRGLLAMCDDTWERFWLPATHRRDRLNKIYL